jgi:hypothetical protein
MSIMLAVRAHRLTGGEELAAIARTLAIVIVGYMVSAFFLTAEYQAVLYLNVGLLLATRKLIYAREKSAPPKAKAAPKHARARHGPRPIAYGAIVAS